MPCEWAKLPRQPKLMSGHPYPIHKQVAVDNQGVTSTEWISQIRLINGRISKKILILVDFQVELPRRYRIEYNGKTYFQKILNLFLENVVINIL